jgi:hypothetical protein
VARPSALVELVEHFTLVPGKLELLQRKARATRLGFALMPEVPDLEGPVSAGPRRATGRGGRARGPTSGCAAADVGSYDWVWAPPLAVGVRSAPAGSQLLAGDHRGHAPISDGAAAQAGAGSLTLVVLSTTASMKP